MNISKNSILLCLGLLLSVMVQAQRKDTLTEDSQYQYKVFADNAAAKKYYKNLDSTQQHILCTINRQNETRILRKSAYWVPTIFSDEALQYAPFPKSIDDLSGIKKVILISIRLQAFGLYENGNLTYWGAVSTGKKSTPTPNGLHFMTFKKKVKVSTINEDWIMPWYFNIDIYRGIALHEYDLPGYPASHGCIRMQERDAMYVYDWGDQWKYSGNTLIKRGTPVILFGKYDYDLPKSNYFTPTNITNEELQELKIAFSQLQIP